MELATQRTQQACAQCGTSLEDASLILVCGHHVCLGCAARLLSHHTGSGPIVRCGSCHAVTRLEEKAAACLQTLREPSRCRAAVPAASRMGVPASLPPDIPRLVSPEAAAASAVPAGDASLRLHTPRTMPPEVAPRAAARGGGGSDWGGSSGSRGAPVQRAAAAGDRSDWPGATARRMLQMEAESTPSKASPTKPEASVACSTKAKCGQCEEQFAELLCEQCVELFCRQCSDSIHRRGKLALHNISTYVPSGDACPTGADGFGTLPTPGQSKLLTPAGASLPIMQRQFLACPAHPDEPLQFVCVECASECICAECALHGDHRGHDVLNLREAARQLPQRAAELRATASARAEELAGLAGQAQDGERELGEAARRREQGLRSEVERARSRLRLEEAAVLASADRCSEEVEQMLGAEPEDERAGQRRVQDAHAQLRQALRGAQALNGDPAAQALNAYARLRQALQALPPQRREASPAELEELKSQLQWGFDARLSAVLAAAARASQLGEPPSAADNAGPAGRQARQPAAELRSDAPPSWGGGGSSGRAR